MFPITGADGVSGWAGIIALADEADVQPVELVTVNVYVPAAMPEKTVVVPDPVVVAPPGLSVTVHVPEEGKPLNAMLPVARVQVGEVIVPI